MPEDNKSSSSRFRIGRESLSKTLTSNASNNTSNRLIRDNNNSLSSPSRDASSHRFSREMLTMPEGSRLSSDNSSSSSSSSSDTSSNNKSWNKDSNRNAKNRNSRNSVNSNSRRSRRRRRKTSRTAASHLSRSSTFETGVC